MANKIRFSDLSGALKTLVVLGWIFIVLSIVTFILSAVIAAFLVASIASYNSVELEENGGNVAVQVMEEVNAFSTTCENGMYGVGSRNNVTCEAPRNCSSNADCSYLDIDSLPTRIGYCREDGVCAATCGSGRIFECR